MEMPQGTRTDRPIRLFTASGLVQGTLRISGMLRTLDDLNIASRSFIQVHDVDRTPEDWKIRSGSIAVRRSEVLFAVENGDSTRKSGRAGAGFSRAPMRILVGDYDIEGFVHVPPGGEPMTRILQHAPAFLALTSASVSHADRQFAVDFIAVNRGAIRVAQTLFAQDEECPTDSSRDDTHGITVG